MNHCSPSQGSRRGVWAEFSIGGRGHVSRSPLCPAKILHVAEMDISAEGGISSGGQERVIARHPAASPAAPTFLTTWVINAILEMPNSTVEETKF